MIYTSRRHHKTGRANLLNSAITPGLSGKNLSWRLHWRSRTIWTFECKFFWWETVRFFSFLSGIVFSEIWKWGYFVRVLSAVACTCFRISRVLACPLCTAYMWTAAARSYTRTCWNLFARGCSRVRASSRPFTAETQWLHAFLHTSFSRGRQSI